MKIEKLYDYDGQIDGYKLGDYYLMKLYTWGNHYEWIINKTGENHYYTCEFDKKLDNGEVILCDNFKQGKQKLIELNK